jgi:hypothetical protein
MQPLILEYVFEGHQRGYNFTSPTHGYSDAILKAIWRSAMPRGQGWAAYDGAHALKTFVLDDGRVAVSDVVVTGERDESGRGGIRRAEIRVMYPGAYGEYLKDRLSRYPAAVQAAVARRPSLTQRAQLLDRSLPRLRGSAQIVLAHPYTTPENWQVVEALVIKLALSPLLLLGRLAQIVPFTTLALDARDEQELVALPADKAARAGDVPVVDLR